MSKHLLRTVTTLVVVLILPIIYLPTAHSQDGDDTSLLPPLEPISVENLGNLEVLMVEVVDSTSDIRDVDIAMRDSGYLIAIAVGDVLLWSLSNSGSEIIPLDDKTSSRVQEIALSEDGHAIAVFYNFGGATVSNPIYVHDTDTRAHVMRIAPAEATWSTAFSIDGTQVVTGQVDEACIWDVPTGELTNCFHLDTQYNNTRIDAVALSPTEPILAMAQFRVGVGVWDIQTGELLRLSGADPVDVMTFDPSGEQLAYSILNGEQGFPLNIWSWKARDGVVLQKDDTVFVSDFTFSPDSKMLIGSGYTTEIWFWDVETGELIETLNPDLGTVGAIAVSSDGLLLVSVDDQGNVILWGVPQEDTP